LFPTFFIEIQQLNSLKMKTKIKKDWYGRLKSVEELHNDATLWISEINFINDEIRFLNHLLSSNYIDFLEAGLDKKIKGMIKKLDTEKNMGNILYKNIILHKKIMRELIETKSVTSNKNYLETHKKLEREVYVYFKKYRKIKKNIFNLVESIMRKKEQKKLVGVNHLN